MEFALGGAAAVCAVCFTNPLEVVKTRFQLQGELKARGQYAVHYSNFFHAMYVIAKKDGILALQKGLGPAAVHQMILNGTRLGGYQVAEDRKWFLNKKGEVSVWKSSTIGAGFGALGGFLGSPLYLVKTHLQSKSDKSIAVGHQHEHENTASALRKIYRQFGISGLWRGASGAVVRIAVGSSVQLSSFSILKEYFKFYDLFQGTKYLDTFAAGAVAGVGIALVMAPFDLISTRLYNQGVDANGKGLLYKTYFECVAKSWQKEGLHGMYKGVLPCYLRIGPHSCLSLLFWDIFKTWKKNFFPSTTNEIKPS